ncbi:DUF1269 domain-containing protein [Gilvimarinus sp. F26214L]|uniref:DUF1269 domain-containing protein n=1 Tax=Gilvimarinus sp. DZF01 TaxID=3461371 RepID=UPI00404651C2
MKRLCFLSPDIPTAERLVDMLESNGIPEAHIYTVARSDIDTSSLPDAGPEADDFLASYQRGVFFGGSTGLAAGLLVRLLAPAGILSGGAVLVVSLLGAGLGGLLTSLAGSAFSSSRLKKFQHSIEEGSILVLADVPEQDFRHWEHRVREVEPRIQVMGAEPRARLIP